MKVFRFRDRKYLRALVGMFALLSLFPRVGQAGLYTSPFNPTDTSAGAAWSNPAGMTSLKAFTTSAGVGVMIPVWKFKTEVSEAGGGDSGQAGLTSVLPTVSLVAPLSDRFHFGLSFFSPLGGPNGLGWEFDDDWAGRYGSLQTTFASMSIAPSVAYKATDKWSFGGGVAAQWLKANLGNAIATPLGDAKVEAKDLTGWSGRFFLGTHYQVSPTTSFGLVYRSKWSPDVKGDLVVSGSSVELPRQDFTLEANLPQQVEVGVQHVFSPTWILSVSGDWEDWSQFNNLGVKFSLEDGEIQSTNIDFNFHSTFSIGASLTHVIGKSNFLEFGANYASSPVDDEDRTITLPADSALTLNAGIAHMLSESTLLSFGGAVVFSGDARVSEVNQGFAFEGSFDTNLAFILAGGIQW
jgi:long-chain fatty acid transport protein